MKREYRRWVPQLIVSAGFILFLVKFVNQDEVLRSLSSIDMTVFAVSGVPLAAVYLFSSLRWRSIMADIDSPLKFFTCMKIIAVSYGFNKFLPLNMGDIARSKITERYSEVDQHGTIIGGVAIERSADVLTLAMLTAISSSMIASNAVDYAHVIILFGLAVSAALSLPFLFPGLFSRFIQRFPAFLVPGTAQQFLEQVLKSYKDVGRTTMLKVMFYSVLRWLAGISILYLAAVSLNASIPLELAVFTNSAMGLVAALPISPGGVGPVETVGTALITFGGQSSAVALSTVIVSRAVGFVAMGVIGYLVYTFAGKSQ